MGMMSAILTVLGIFVGIPLVIGFGVAGLYALSRRDARRAERIKAAEQRVAEALPQQHAEVQGEGATEEMTKEGVPVAYR